MQFEHAIFYEWQLFSKIRIGIVLVNFLRELSFLFGKKNCVFQLECLPPPMTRIKPIRSSATRHDLHLHTRRRMICTCGRAQNHKTNASAPVRPILLWHSLSFSFSCASGIAPLTIITTREIHMLTWIVCTHVCAHGYHSRKRYASAFIANVACELAPNGWKKWHFLRMKVWYLNYYVHKYARFFFFRNTCIIHTKSKS